MKLVNEMQLIPEQMQQVRDARLRGERRMFVSFTPEQRQAWREMVDQELAGKEGNVSLARKVKAAAEQPGFFGDIRRAVLLSRRPIAELSMTIGVETRTLSDFCAGDAELPAFALDGLVATLGLRLMQEIPR
jgi:hypothetical protein